MGGFTKVATTEEVQPGKVIAVEVDSEQVAIYNIDGRFFATSAICPHQGGPLEEGEIEDGQVICPLHGWRFDVKDGTCKTVPKMDVKTYELKVEGDDILVRVED